MNADVGDGRGLRGDRRGLPRKEYPNLLPGGCTSRFVAKARVPFLPTRTVAAVATSSPRSSATAVAAR